MVSTLLVSGQHYMRGGYLVMKTDELLFCLGRAYEKTNKNLIFLSAVTAISSFIFVKKIKAQDKKIKELSENIEELKHSKGE